MMDIAVLEVDARISCIIIGLEFFFKIWVAVFTKIMYLSSSCKFGFQF